MSTIPEDIKPSVNETKSNGRDSRLQRTRKVNEEVLRKKLQNEARDICADTFKAFGACAKEQSLMVMLLVFCFFVLSYSYPDVVLTFLSILTCSLFSHSTVLV